MRDDGSPMKEPGVQAHDTRPVWEQVLKEIVDTRRELSMRLDRIEVVVRQHRADLRNIETRIDKIESRLAK
jgi:hypothetical protein